MDNELIILVKNSHKLDSLCRICLAEKSSSEISLFDSSICERVMLCTRVQIQEGDGLPAAICDLCWGDLDRADKFRIRCEYSDSLLRKFYLNFLLKTEKTEDPSNIQETIVKDENSSCPAGKANGTKKKKKLNKLKRPSKEKAGTVLEDESLSGVIKVEPQELDVSFYDTDGRDDHSADEASQQTHSTEETAKLEAKNASNKKFKCHLCGKPLSSKSSIERHISTVHAAGKAAAKGAEAGRRVSGFGRERRFHCGECAYSTAYSQSLTYHARVHSGERPHRCPHPQCARSFSQPGSLSAHRKTHSERTYFTCAECGKQFKYKETYENHRKVHSGLRAFACPECGKGLKSRATLRAHLDRHSNTRNFSCETCGATFVTRVELLNHARRHKPERDFHCAYCDFRSYHKKGLSTHLLRHSGERAFKCDLCGAACYTRGELKCHARKHTKEKNYSCPVCDLKFIHSSSVNKHMRNTHGIKYRRNDTIDRRIIK